MRNFLMTLGITITFFSCTSKDTGGEQYPVYNGTDLGLTYTPQKSIFKIWAPTASDAEIIFYAEGAGENETARHNMTKEKNGVWSFTGKSNLKGSFYAFRVKIDSNWLNEVPDPYAKTVGINGKRAMVIDLSETNPEGWEQDKSPSFHHPTDAVIYELHVRDASIAENSGIKNKGKFLGLTETGTQNPDGLSTGLDHIKEMGVTHVHLLPVFDFYSIDETKASPNYNWGYDPLNYNVPEGSYATNPYDGITRIKEFKQLIKAFHENGLRVVMDVVYNHTALTETSNFNQLVPEYYYRHTADGKFSNATACGNETASEKPMFRKFMLESMKYWVEEYHIDGFRVDLMGVHDIETMNLISKELHTIKPGILLYGEGWTANPSPLPDSLRALKANASQLDRIAVFSDDIRDGIKGSVFDHADRGFVSNKPGMEESVKFGIVASCQHPEVDYSKINYSKAPYSSGPAQTITYCECHDNHVLWDKLALSAKKASEAERKEMYKLALSIVLTSQGITFLHAGTELIRSKQGEENSFESPDSINAIDWGLKTKNREMSEYVKGLIKLRKEHPLFRLQDAKSITGRIRFTEMPEGTIGYEIKGSGIDGEQWQAGKVFFNGTDKEQAISLDSNWQYAINNNRFETGQAVQGNILLKPYSCTVLYQ